MRKLRLIQAQPATDYYAWQVEVNLKSTLGFGYNGNYIDVVASYKDSIPQSWLKLQQAYPYVRFFFYRDEMGDCNYAPAIQSHILKKHFTAFPELSEDAIFFHDCDFIFTKHFDFEPFLHDDNWYFSDTRTYVGSEYIESKGSGLLEGMCQVVGLCACTVRSKKEGSGGAQKLMKNVTAEYWAEVEEDSVNLYNWLIQNKDNYGDAEVNDIQIWTASMWAELWNAWKYKHNVIVPTEFNFSWATCPAAKWDLLSFYHNAGVTDSKRGMFFKAAYIDKLPYGEELELSPDVCSSKYFEIVKETGKTSVLID